MNTKHRRASRYKRDPNVLNRVLGRLQPFTPTEQTTLNLPVRLSFELLRTGKATEVDFHNLAFAINAAMVRSESINPLVEQPCIAARDALLRVWARHQRTGKWLFDGPGLNEVRVGIEVYEDLTAMLTAGDMEKTLKECARRMQVGLALGGQGGAA